MIKFLRKLKYNLIHFSLKRVDYIGEDFLSSGNLVRELMNYDVISFDIFDTLIFRPFLKPSDLFKIVGEKLNIKNFEKIRIDCERRYRAKTMWTKSEVSIYNIYDSIAEKTGISKEYGISVELDIEKKYCYANPYMQKVFDNLVNCEKEVIIVSDMYLPHDMMEEILLKTGYKNYKKLYVSCDYNFSKENGGLYKIVLEDIGSKSMVHIGDNLFSDIKSAKRFNIATKLYKKTN